ncbi:hypothetical protein AAZV13_01G109050 [Glycine max]
MHFFYKAEAKSLFEINMLEEIVCVTVGTITKIVMENHSWCYVACIHCYKKTDVDTIPFTYACDLRSWLPTRRNARNFCSRTVNALS